jgi:hypothetical protein
LNAPPSQHPLPNLNRKGHIGKPLPKKSMMIFFNVPHLQHPLPNLNIIVFDTGESGGNDRN